MTKQRVKNKAVLQHAVAQAMERRILLSDSAGPLVVLPHRSCDRSGMVVPFAQTATTTAVTSSSGSTTYGQSVTFTATVTPASGSGETGSIQFQIDGSNAGSPIIIASNVATYTTAVLAAGSHSIVAIYSGDGNFAGSTSGAVTQTVAQVSPTTTWALNTLASFSNGNGEYPYAGVTMDSYGNLFGTTYEGGAYSGEGTAFEIAHGSQVITTLASFNYTNGQSPDGGVVVDSYGNLFGTTYQGGASDYGTVFEIAYRSNAITTLGSFNYSNGGGDYPEGNVTLDSSGNLFGTSSLGGAGNCGTIFEVAHGTSAITTVSTFSGNAGSEPAAGVVLDSAGDLFGTTEYGGTNGYGTVFEVAHGSQSITVLAPFNGANGEYTTGGVVLDSAGDLFGAAYSGGSAGDGDLFEIAYNSKVITVLASFSGPNGKDPMASLTLDSSANLFGTASAGGPNGAGTVFELAHGSATITTLTSFNGANGQYSAGSLVFDASGNLFGTTEQGGASSDGTVFKMTPTTTGVLVTSNTLSASFGQPVTFTATITPNVGVGPTGTVQFQIDGQNVASPITLTGNTATYTTSSLALGSHSIIATYSGDGNFTVAVSPTFTQYVRPATTTAVVSSNGAIAYGQSVTFTATVIPSSGSGETGTVQFQVDGVNLGSPVVLSSNTATFTTSTISAGSHSITATYSGDGNFGSSTSPAITQSVAQVTPSTTTVTSSNGSSTYCQSVTFTATISPNVGSGATGTVQFQVDGGNVGSAVAVSNSVATYTTTALSLGIHSIVAMYSGDGNFAASTSPSFTQAVGLAASITTITSSIKSPAFGQSITFTATVTPNVGVGPTGNVQFQIDGVNVGNPVPLTGNSATCTTSSLSLGSHLIIAIYSGDGNFTAGVSGVFTQHVCQTTTTVVTSNNGSPGYGASVTFTATVTPASGSGETGTVQFQIDGSNVGSAVILSGNTATYSTSTLSVGSHSIVAIYSGDTNFAAGVSAVYTQNVARGVAPMTVTSSIASATFGQSVTFTATFSTFDWQTGTIQFQADGANIGSPVFLSVVGYGATYTTSALTAGSHSIVAVYSGDQNFLGGVSTPHLQSVVKMPAGTTWALTTLAYVYGQYAEGNVVMDSAGDLFSTATSGGTYGDGVVFEVAYGSSLATSLASFNGNNGATPGDVILDSAGDLFGTTTSGGLSNDGTVYEIAHGSTFLTALVSFNSVSGGGPCGNVVLDSAGNLYGATNAGGAAGVGAIYEIAKGSASFTVLASFNHANGANPTSSITLDSSGDIFGAASAGGTSNYGTVYELVHGSSVITSLASFNKSNGQSPWSDVVQDQSGNLFSAASGGGANSDGTVIEIANGSTAITVLAVFNYTNGAGPIGNIAIDPSGNLYGSAQAGGAYGNGVIYELAHGSSAITSLVTFNSTNGSRPLGGVLLNSCGNLFGTTCGNSYGAVFEVSPTAVQIGIGSNNSAPLVGQPVTFTASITPVVVGVGPTGSVQFQIDGVNVGSPVAVIGNAASLTLSSLPEGNHSVVAVYSGDGNYASATAPACVQSVIATSTTAVASNNPSATYGQSITFTATVTPSSGSGETGTVQFQIDGSNVGSAIALSGNTATYTTATLGAGNHSIVAIYSGGGDFSGSTSVVFQQSVTRAGATTVTTSSNGSSTYGQSVTFTATITPASGSGETGTVQFQIDGSNVGSPIALAGNIAAYTVPLLTVGSHVIVAFYSGDSNFQASSSGAFTQTVSRFSAVSSWPATALASFNSANGANPYYGLTMDSAGNLYGATHSGGSLGYGDVFEIAPRSASITVLASFPSGNYGNPYGGVILDSSGDIFGAATGGYGDFYEIAHGSGSFTILATFSSANGSPGAGVAMDSSGDLFDAAFSGGAYGDGTIVELPHGSNVITTLATFNGANGQDPFGVVLDSLGDLFGTAYEGGAKSDGCVFELACGSGTITNLISFNGYNGQEPPVGVILDSAGDLFGTAFGGAYGDGLVFEFVRSSASLTTIASFNGTNGSSPYGGVSFDSSGDLFGTTYQGGANADGTVYEIASGSALITALASLNSATGINSRGGVILDSYGDLYGTALNGGAGGYGSVFEVTRVGVIVTSSNAAPTLGQAVTFTATVLPVIGAGPTGTVQFQIDGVNVGGPVTLNGSTAPFVTSSLSLGTHSITAIYSGDGNYTTATSLTFTQIVGNLTTTVITSGNVLPTYGEPVTFTATITSATGSGETGAVQFQIDGSNVGGPVALSGNIATYTASLLSTGSHSVVAIYSGDGSFAASASGVLAQSVSKIIPVTGWTLNTLAAFNNANGSNPLDSMVFDSSGDLFGTTDMGGASGCGVVFEMAAGSDTLTALAMCNTATGKFPSGGLALDCSGDLFGVAQTGGENNDGTVFEIAYGSRVISVLASFNSTNGADPYAGVIIDSYGNLYGTTEAGGLNGDGTVFEISQGSGIITTLASFNGANGKNPYGGVEMDSSGDLFGTTETGGLYNDGAVFEIAQGSGIITTLASFNGANGKNPYAGLTPDSFGDLFGTTFSGGASGSGVVFELGQGSGSITTVASFNYANGANPYDTVTLDPAGDLFGTTSSGGVGSDGTVFEVANGSGISVLACFSNTTGVGFPKGGVVLDSFGDLFGLTPLVGYGSTVIYGTVFELTPASTTGLIATITASNPAPTFGQSVTFTATITPNLGVGPTGTVQFRIDGSNVGGPVILNGNAATFTTSTLGVGIHSIVAIYSGDINYGATYGGLAQNIEPASTVTSTAVTSSNDQPSYGQSIIFTATVTPNIGVGPTGNVQFQIDGANFGSPVTLTGNTATLTTSMLSIGNHSIVAVYSGDSNFTAATSPTFIQTVVAPAANVIEGWVFNDAGNSGVPGVTADGMASVSITLTPTGGTAGSPVTIATAADGSYSFTAVSPGTYTVSETPPTGYALTTPVGNQTVTVTAGQGVVGPVFGDVQISSIPLNFTMLVMLSQNYGKPGTFASGDVNGDGWVNFTDLVLLSQNYNGTLPPSQYAGSMQAAPMNASASAMMPALFPVAPKTAENTIAIVKQTTESIAGAVFNDLNGDGIQEKGEAGIAGRSVYLRIPGAATRGQRIATTNSAGQFCLANVLAGNYLIVISQPIGWRSTTVPSDSYPITLAGGASAAGLAFGQSQTASIGGNVGLVAAAGQASSASESALAGWTLTLTNSANAKIVYTAVTDAQGNYLIPSAPAGTYVLSLSIKPGYAPLTPAGGRYTLHVYAAQTLTGKSFSVAAIPVTISAVRTVDPLDKSMDVVTFYALDNTTGAWAGSSKLVAEDLTLSCSSGLEIRTYDADGSGLVNDADLTGQNAAPTTSFVRLGGPSFFVASTTPKATAGGFVDDQMLKSFEVAGALLMGGAPATLGAGARIAVAVVKHGVSVTLAGSLAADVGAPVPVSFFVT